MILFLVACFGKTEAPPSAPEAAPTSWVSGIKGWYCGEETRTEADKPRVFNVALKLAPGKDGTSFTGTYAKVEGRDKEIGGLTHFVAGGERTATLKYADSAKKKGEATFVFAPDYSSVTVTWGAENLTATLAASEMSRCVAGPLIK
jgi:hypothetical protein